MKQIENIELEGIYCDAIVKKGDMTVFASLWGRSASLMSLYGSIINGTTSSLLVYGQHWQVEKTLDKMQARMNKHSKYGSDLVHSMLFVKMTQMDVGGQRILLSNSNNDSKALNDSIWSALNQCSEIALMPKWQDTLLEKLVQTNFIRPLEAININAILLDISKKEEYEELICQMIKSGELGVSE